MDTKVIGKHFEKIDELHNKMETIEQAFAFIRGVVEVLSNDYEKKYNTVFGMIVNAKYIKRNLCERRRIINTWKVLINRYEELNMHVKTLLLLVEKEMQ
jgi:hypothetical protein